VQRPGELVDRGRRSPLLELILTAAALPGLAAALGGL
jgi:hypothetical protein